MRWITGVVVTLAAAAILLQLFWTGAPLPADPSGAPAFTHQASIVSRGGTSDDAVAASDDAGDAPAGARPTLQSMSSNALRLSRRTLSWIQSVSLGGPAPTAGGGGSNHSASSDHTRATSGHSSQPDAAGFEDPLPTLRDASGSMHALSAQDISAVGAPVGSGRSPGWSNSGMRGRHVPGRGLGAGEGTPEALRPSPEMTRQSPGSGHGVGGLRGREGGAGSRHRAGSAASPQRPPTLRRPVSHEGLANGAAGGAALPVRRAQKVLDKCNIQGCPYRPRSVVTALLRPTAEFHYCYR